MPLRSRPLSRLSRNHYLAFLSGVFALSVVSCGREPTSARGVANTGAVRLSQGLSWIAAFPAGFPQFQAAGGGAAFTKVRIVLNNADGSIALDTVVNFPEGSDALTITLSIKLPASAPAGGVPLVLNLDYQNAAGQTVFHGGPVTVTAVPAVPGAGPPPPSPVVIPISYVGPGAGATKVVITPKIANVAMGGGFSFSAQAFNGDTPLANTPIIFNIANGALATLNAATGSGVAAAALRGTTTVTAQLLTGPTDVATLNVTPIASAIALVSGSGQTGNVGTTLANPLVVRVTAPDGLPVSGVAVSFTASNGGTAAGTTSDASGLASTSWKLGTFVGAQSVVASAAGAGSVNFTATAKAADPAKLEFVTQPPSAVASGATFGASVRVLDTSNQLTSDFTGLVTLSAVGGGGSLLGTAAVNAVGGVATFSGLRITVPGTYTLTATSSAPSGPIAPASSGSVVVNPGAVTSLQFSAYPGGSTAGAALGQVTVSVRDSAGNVATNYAGAVALTVGVGPSGGGLLGTTTVNAVAGIATFSSLQINIAGSYALRATANGVSVTGSVTLAIGGTGAIASVRSNLASANPAVIVTSPPAPAPANAFSGSTTANAVGGIATFDGVQLTAAGTYRFSASAAGLPTANGPTFIVSAGPAARLRVVSGSGQTGAAGAALPQQIGVQVTDAYSNSVTGGSISFTPSSGGSASPLSGSTNSGGQLFTTWTLGAAAGAQTLTASSAGLAGTTATATASGVAAPTGPVYGYSSLLPQSSSHSPHFLLGSVISVPTAVTLTHISVIMRVAGPMMKMALYSDVGGNPGTLLASTGPTVVAAGVNEFPVANVSLPPGNYWIMGIFNTTASTGFDYSGVNPAVTDVVKYIALSFGSPLPTTFPSPTVYSGQRFNYYIRVQ